MSVGLLTFNMAITAMVNPFCTLARALMLKELNSGLINEAFRVAVELILNTWREDGRFLAALSVLESKLVYGRILVENPNRKLVGFPSERKGNPVKRRRNGPRDGGLGRL
jgi:hypothetical protein